VPSRHGRGARDPHEASDTWVDVSNDQRFYDTADCVRVELGPGRFAHLYLYRERRIGSSGGSPKALEVTSRRRNEKEGVSTSQPQRRASSNGHLYRVSEKRRARSKGSRTRGNARRHVFSRLKYYTDRYPARPCRVITVHRRPREKNSSRSTNPNTSELDSYETSRAGVRDGPSLRER